MNLSYETTAIMTFALAGVYIICCVVLTRNLDGFERSGRLEGQSYRKTELEEIFGL